VTLAVEETSAPLMACANASGSLTSCCSNSPTAPLISWSSFTFGTALSTESRVVTVWLAVSRTSASRTPS
jgi:hypothetical protein